MMKTTLACSALTLLLALAAAGLCCGHNDLTARVFQQLERGKADIGPNEID